MCLFFMEDGVAHKTTGYVSAISEMYSVAITNWSITTLVLHYPIRFVLDLKRLEDGHG